MPADLATYRVGGTRRVCAPAETLRRLAPRLRDFGITRVANVTGLDNVGIPVVMVCRPNGSSLSVAQGKGTDLDAAKASGVMEAVEHHFAESFAPRDLRLAASSVIEAEGGVPDVLWPKGAEPRRAQQRQVWLRAETRSRQPSHWVPFDLVHLDLATDHPLSHHAFPVTSSGLCSGNTWQEAVLHGALELIERDAMALFFLREPGRQLERRLDPRSVTGAVSGALLQRFARAGIRVAMWDITTDLGVAAILCAILEDDPDPSRRSGVSIGAGCHLEREVAVIRALCEAAQSRLTRIAGSRDDIEPDVLAGLRSAEREQHWRSLMVEPSRMRRFDELADACHPTLTEDLDDIERRLRASDVGPLLAVELGTSEEPVTVVRVLVPGLEPHSEAPGRAPGLRAAALLSKP